MMKTLVNAICLFLLPIVVSAQEPAAVRKVGLPSLDTQVRARLVSLDERLNPVHSPTLASSITTHLANPWSPLGAFAPILADERNNEVWEQSVDDYVRLMLDSGDVLVTVVESPRGTAWTSEQVRRLCHQRLMMLPRTSRDVYRQRVAAEAEALLAQGRTKLSPLPLRRLTDELFSSRSGDAALDLLGDLAFERGRFDEAWHWWNVLRTQYADPKADVVRVEAKQILATMFQGRLDEANAAITRFVKTHPDARGDLAGENGAYHPILRKALSALQRERIANNDEPWTTFGGDPSRNRTLSQGLSWHLFEDGPTWRVPLLSASSKNDRIDYNRLARGAVFHPIIVHDQVLIADHRSVVSYHLKTGKEAFRFDLKAADLKDPGPIADVGAPWPRFTLSADQDRAYVRLGAVKAEPRKNGDKDDPSYLVCLDLTEPGRVKNRLLWHVEANGDANAPAWFEGSPLVYDGRVYVAVSKNGDRRVVSAIRCYDLLGRLRWSRDVCDAPEYPNGGRRRHELLTLAGSQIVFASQMGAIVAVDASTGQPTWGVRYPSRGPLTPEHEPSPRDLAPCVYSDGRIYAAPADTDRLFCLDAVTGHANWEAAGVEIVHLLGVAHGRVYTATRAGLQSFNATSGQPEWQQPSEGRLPSLGRGLLAGSWLYWPTQDAQLPYRAVTLRDGAQMKAAGAASALPEKDFYSPTMFAQMPAGNWAFGQGCLAIAGLTELVVFAPPRHLPVHPGDPRPHARLETLHREARFFAYAGKADEAKQSYANLLEATKAHPRAAEWRKLVATRIELVAPSDHSAKASATPTPAGDGEVFFRGPALPLVRAWDTRGGRIWTSGDADRFLSTHAGQVSCRTVADGTLCWRSPLKFEPTWVGSWRGVALFVGADGAQAFRLGDGQPIWTFAAPSRRWPTAFVVDGTPTMNFGTAGFEFAQIWDDTLLLLDDGRQFFRLRCDTGAIVWQHASPAAAIRPLDAAAFSRHVTRVGDRLMVQKIDGQPMWLGGPTVGEKSRSWIQSPAVVDTRILVPSERGTIHAFDPNKPSSLVWSWQAPHPHSLTGEMIRLFCQGSVVLARVPRNDGHEWLRLDANRGNAIWSLSSRAFPDGVDVDSVCIGDTAFYFVADGTLHARSLNDGAERWSQSLATSGVVGWKLRYSAEMLTIHPASTPKDHDFFVAFLDPFDGRWLQRLTFAGARGAGDVVLTKRGAVVSAGGGIFGFRSLVGE